jgi:hypothetical protein
MLRTRSILLVKWISGSVCMKVSTSSRLAQFCEVFQVCGWSRWLCWWIELWSVLLEMRRHFNEFDRSERVFQSIGRSRLSADAICLLHL